MTASPLPVPAVFLSYASQDVMAARRLCEALRASGIEVWFDQSELVGGDVWDAKIRKQIATCALFVPVVSANTQAREEGYFRLEWKLAAQRTHMMTEEKAFVLPVVIDDTRDAEAKVPAEFRAVQWTRLPAGETSAAFCARVRQLLGGGASLPPAGEVAGHGPNPRATAAESTGHRVPAAAWATAVLVVVALGTGVFFAFRKPVGQVAGPGKASPTVVAPVVAADKAVAVLAFKNFRGDPALDYLSDGISEAISSVLGRVPGLRVVGSTSALSFKGKAVPLPEIARQLGVTHLVEGTVLQEGSTVRITAKLLKADGFQVWVSDNLDRELKNILALHDEVAGLIAKQLSLKLGVSSPVATATVNPEAFRHYLEGRQEWNKRTPAGYKRAEQLFEQAIALDPNLARAYVGLADALHLQSRALDVDDLPSVSALRSRLPELLARALELDPMLAEAHVSRAQFFQREEAEREAGLRHGLSLNPSYATGHHWLALSLGRQGRLSEAVMEAKLALQLEPLSPAVHAACALVLNNSHRWAEALEMAERAEALQPAIIYAAGNRVRALIGLNRRAEAVAFIRTKVEDWMRDAGWVANLAEAGDRETAANHAPAIFASAAGRNPLGVFGLYVALGRNEEALEYLEPRTSGVLRNVGEIMAPTFDEIRQHPRFIRALEQSGMADRYARAKAELTAAKKRAGQR